MNIVITGGTGTLGRALIGAWLAARSHKWARLVSYARDEVKAARLAAEFPDPRLRAFLGDIRDPRRLRQAFHGVDAVVHAAALKRVTESVYSPSELIRTNIEGTVNVVNAAAECGVRRVLVISSDKAVHATNLYGATKAVAEGYAVQANAYTAPRGTYVSVLRYGNVLGSRGSVLPYWRRLAREGKPIPVTDPEMTRFWVTLDSAVQFVESALEEMEGGEVFVPRGLPATRIDELARAVWAEADRPPEHLQFHVLGLRPGGEKLHEELLSSEELPRVVGRPTFYVVPPAYAPWRDRGYPGTAPLILQPYRSDTTHRLSEAQLRRNLDLTPREEAVAA